MGVIASPIKPCWVNGEHPEKGTNKARLCQLSPCIPVDWGIVWRLPGGCPMSLVLLSAGSSAAWGHGEGAEREGTGDTKEVVRSQEPTLSQSCHQELNKAALTHA